MISVNLFYFLWLVVYYRSFHSTINYLCTLYHDDVCINLFWKKLYIINTTSSAKSLLSQEQTGLTFANENFFSAHDHPYGIGNLDQSSPLWSIIHKSLSKAISPTIVQCIHNNQHILFGKYGFEYDLKKVLEEFVMSTWAEYSFGPSVNKEKYMYLQKFTIETLRKTFYSASTISLPYVGSWVSRVRKFIYKKDLETIDEMLKDFLSSTSDGYLHRFNQELKASIDNDTLREKILHDNAFLSLLVFDFIYLVLLQVLLNNHEKEKTKHLSKGFLFPNRFRIIKKTSENYQEGDYAIVNLVHSKLFFSYGPRSCVGPMIFEKFYTSLLDSIKDFKISLDNDNVTYSSDPNIPVVTSTHRIRYTLNENYLTQVLPFYEKEESKPLVSQQLQKKLKFYRMEACTENPILFSYIIDSLSQKVPKDCQYIFTAEARGFLFAAPVAHKLGLPLVLMRKKGKIVGPVEAVEYLKAYGSTETLEVPKLSCRGKAIIIDDGIASGGTTQAMYVLSSKVQAEIMKVLVVVRHGYTKCSYTQTPVEHVFAY